jgi:hypothetical protein
MSKKNGEIRKIEAFVRSVLRNNFNQTIDPETLRAVAKKIQITFVAANIHRNQPTVRASSPDQKPCEPVHRC